MHQLSDLLLVVQIQLNMFRASWSVRSDWPRSTALLPPRSNDKPEAATAVYKLLMMGKRMPETCWAVFERRAKNLRDCCIWLVDLFECMMMHGLTNPKSVTVFLSELSWSFMQTKKVRPYFSQQPTNRYVKSDCVHFVSTVPSQCEYTFCSYRAGLCSSTFAVQRQNLMLHCAFAI
jgi:hypothetical protein